MKFYAVKKPLPAAVYESWTECEARVKGLAGALFKSFTTRHEAEQWAGIPVTVSAEVVMKGLRIYVDGSYMPQYPQAGWAWVAVLDGKEVARGSGATPEPALSRNIDGECEAAYHALLWAKEQPLAATICHDYEGLSRWALKQWKANSEIAIQYQQKVIPLLRNHRFEKVKAHSGDPWNELVDHLAKEALTSLSRS